MNRLTSMKFGITKGGSRRAKRWRARPAWSCETVLTAVKARRLSLSSRLARLAAVDADIGPVEGRDRHRTRLSESAGERRGDVRERHPVVGVQNLKALPRAMPTTKAGTRPARRCSTRRPGRREDPH